MPDNSVSKRPKTSQGENYRDGMSQFFGKDVSGSQPVQNYDKAVADRRIGRRPKREKKTWFW